MPVHIRLSSFIDSEYCRRQFGQTQAATTVQARRPRRTPNQNRLQTSAMFCPPKPKLLLSATSQRASRQTLGM